MNKMLNIGKNASDEWKTPRYAIKPILKYLKPNSTIWCPFDEVDSHFVDVLTAAGFNVVHTHLKDDHDFFKTEPPANCDYIISNPPFSCKDAVYERLFKLGIPFMMLMNLQGFADSKVRAKLFSENNIQVMYIYPRVCYIKDGVQTTGNIFQSGYICGCGKILPRDIVIENIEKEM